MSNIGDVIQRVQEMYEYNKPKKSFKPMKVEDDWERFLAVGKPEYKGMQYYHVRATELYRSNNVYDTELGFVPNAGTEFVVDGERLDKLLHSPYGALVEVDGRA